MYNLIINDFTGGEINARLHGFHTNALPLEVPGWEKCNFMKGLHKIRSSHHVPCVIKSYQCQVQYNEHKQVAYLYSPHRLLSK